MKITIRSFVFALTILLVDVTLGQGFYQGTLGKYPITMDIQLDSYDPGATYFYDKYRTPIKLKGEVIKGSLMLKEFQDDTLLTATVVFENYEPDEKVLKGVWMSADSSKSYPLELYLVASKEVGLEVLQAESTKEHYFKTVIKASEDDPYPMLREVLVYAKKTNVLVQRVKVECDPLGRNSVSVGDFNFDGVLDFSVFEASYAGSNTSSLYYLYDEDSARFVTSEYSGTSLTFDYENELVVAHNSCCAGTERYITYYKVVDNELVVFRSECLVWAPESNAYELVECQKEEE